MSLWKIKLSDRGCSYLLNTTWAQYNRSVHRLALKGQYEPDAPVLLERVDEPIYVYAFQNGPITFYDRQKINEWK